jgi:predicted transcriptional regulator
MTAREILTEVAKLTSDEREMFERLWQQTFADELRERRRAELRAEIEEGLDQTERGEFSEITDRTLDQIQTEVERP